MTTTQVLNRRKVLSLISATPQSSKVLQESSELPKATLYRVLRFLEAEGLVTKSGAGSKTAYRTPSAEEVVCLALKSSEEPLYSINLTSMQAHWVCSSLELFSRLGIWQLRELESDFRERIPSGCDFDAGMLVAESLATDVAELKSAISDFNSSASFSIRARSVDPRFQGAWDLHVLLRHRLAWHRSPCGGMGVNFDEPISGTMKGAAFAFTAQDSSDSVRVVLSVTAPLLSLVEQALQTKISTERGNLGFLRTWLAEGLLKGKGDHVVPPAAFDHHVPLISRIEAALKTYPASKVEVGDALLSAIVARDAKTVTSELPDVKPFLTKGLPAGFRLAWQRHLFAVLREAESMGQPCFVLNSSSDAMTAIQYAWNQSEGRPARKFS